ncbi:Heat shock protein DnaJ-like protein [Tumidithrix helvetica PCC 7403]|uniref:molecular chaperone DnaJ n=1 Tax=Tumidithrix helvetica TaxID=3457545 RepID=UPI003C9AF2A0
MPTKTSTAKAPSTKASKPKKEKVVATLNTYIQGEITRLEGLYSLERAVLETFAQFVVENHKKKDVVVKPLTLAQLKEAIYKEFAVKNTTELKKSGAFNMATNGITDLNLTVKDGWERLYRKFIGILPNEMNEQGYGCINGINIFNYSKPWTVLALDPKTATLQDIKNAYHGLSKIYHPDVPVTGDTAIFDRITTMYKSISAEA